MIAEQEKVKRDLDRIIQIFKASEGVVRPHFFLTGPSGSGKSHIVEAIATEYSLGFVEINAAQLTKEGTSGNSLSKALTPLLNSGGVPTLCFVDEFDKLFISGNTNTALAHETTNGVQNEFLRVLESATTSVFGDYGKYVQAPVDNVLFVFAGAFNGEDKITLDRLRDFGIKTEFLGRVGMIYNLEKLSIQSMYVALQNSQLLTNYLGLFPNFERAKVEQEIMEVVAQQHNTNTLGIRMLNTLLHQYFINGGELRMEQVNQTNFQTTLDFSAGS
ncbi:P-loop containing nucleoside triphosphate hydrolase [Vibrio phage 2.117.O._10N.261.45.E9]|nr:P-loop containing nucleoside triphosphate hydrolase [Vibrio phage 1.117.O._10N.261.45.E9]AUR95473.1 P-loop containing nucleoside triphosphate hydrolase [Vibrio phage 1.207.B._10N.222.51.C2]AUS02364.1 P-loop containing nucleoside triphosphate hydrolase [Vibrio phage 2.117.O._10N.261.45.E9]